MKKIYFSVFILILIISFASFSWREGPGDGSELEFPYVLYEYKLENRFSDRANVNDNLANLGRVLFYDTALSIDESTSCGSCHKQEKSFADDLAFSEGLDNRLTTRNSLHLNDLGWQPSQGLFWDLRSSKPEDAVLEPIIHPDELGLDFLTLTSKLKEIDYYPPLFEYAFDDDEITKEKIGLALSEFIQSMVTTNSKFDKDLLSPTEREGQWIFASNCGNCHHSPHFSIPKNQDPLLTYTGVNSTNFFIVNNGLDSIYADEGMGGWVTDVPANDPDKYQSIFKSPTLRNIELTAPYMHNGRFETLEEVVDFYSDGIQPHVNAFSQYYGNPSLGISFKGFEFDEVEKSKLIAFLKTLTDWSFTLDPKWSDPFLEEPIEIKDEVIFYDFYASPNPVIERTMIHISNSVEETYNLTLVNMEGVVVREMLADCGQYELFRGGLPSGMYYLNIQNEKLSNSIKLIFK